MLIINKLPQGISAGIASDKKIYFSKQCFTDNDSINTTSVSITPIIEDKTYSYVIYIQGKEENVTVLGYIEDNNVIFNVYGWDINKQFTKLFSFAKLTSFVTSNHIIRGIVIRNTLIISFAPEKTTSLTEQEIIVDVIINIDSRNGERITRDHSYISKSIFPESYCLAPCDNYLVSFCQTHIERKIYYAIFEINFETGELISRTVWLETGYQGKANTSFFSNISLLSDGSIIFYENENSIYLCHMIITINGIPPTALNIRFTRYYGRGKISYDDSNSYDKPITFTTGVVPTSNNTGIYNDRIVYFNRENSFNQTPIIVDYSGSCSVCKNGIVVNNPIETISLNSMLHILYTLTEITRVFISPIDQTITTEIISNCKICFRIPNTNIIYYIDTSNTHYLFIPHVNFPIVLPNNSIVNGKTVNNSIISMISGDIQNIRLSGLSLNKTCYIIDKNNYNNGRIL